MGEVTHTSEIMLGLRRSKGRGQKLWAGAIVVSDDETLNTGLDHIEGAAFSSVEDTAIDANTGIAWIKSHSGGTITFKTGVLGAYTDATDMVAWGIVIGRVD